MSNLLHETIGSGHIDLQAENDRLREIIQLYKSNEKENLKLIDKILDENDVMHKELHTTTSAQQSYEEPELKDDNDVMHQELHSTTPVEEYYDMEDIVWHLENGTLSKRMGWDPIHGPSDEELEALDKKVTKYYEEQGSK